jgi:hypothetical protein
LIEQRENDVPIEVVEKVDEGEEAERVGPIRR